MHLPRGPGLLSDQVVVAALAAGSRLEVLLVCGQIGPGSSPAATVRRVVLTPWLFLGGGRVVAASPSRRVVVVRRVKSRCGLCQRGLRGLHLRGRPSLGERLLTLPAELGTALCGLFPEQRIQLPGHPVHHRGQLCDLLQRVLERLVVEEELHAGWYPTGEYHKWPVR